MPEGRNSQHAWPGEGVARVPYSVYEDSDLYEAELGLIFRGPVWNYFGLEIPFSRRLHNEPCRRHGAPLLSGIEAQTRRVKT